MNRFGPDPLEFFNLVYQHSAPWDIGAPQPAMIALLEKYPPTAPILDLGCGPGDLAIYLAKLGHKVVGIDFVESAIQSAQAKADALPPETSRLLNFEVGDALQLSKLQQTFAAVVDSGFYHLFNPDESERLIDEVGAVSRPGGRYYLHEFAIEFPAPNLPRQILPEEIQTRFKTERGWRILEIQSVDFLSRVAPPVPATCACIERLP